MLVKNITSKERSEFNLVATHPLQSYEWGEFREKTGVRVIRRGLYDGDKIIAGFQVTIHKLPHTKQTIGYLPKGTIPTQELLQELVKIGKEEKCIFIQLEPNVEQFQISNFSRLFNSGIPYSNIQGKSQISNYWKLLPAAHPLFTKYTFQLDLTKTEDELLKQMHSKTRYNVRVAQKHNVEVKEETSDEAFKEYLKLTHETTTRQGFYAHTPKYHEIMWKTLGEFNKSSSSRAAAELRSHPYNQTDTILDSARTINNTLTAHLLIAYYNSIPLTTWVLFIFHDTLYYPYGASSSEHRETMSSNLMMWEAIKFGKKLGLKKFDMWGSLGENPDPKDPWYGFHRFKMGYNPKLVEFIGSYDLVINPWAYQLYKIANTLRWLFLRFK